MFLIFKYLPDILWQLLPLVGLLCFLSSYIRSLRMYDTILKSIGILVISLGIFILGMLYADNTWKQAASDLQTKAAIAEVKSKEVNTKISETLSLKTSTIKIKGEDITKHIESNSVQYNASCTLPEDFIITHNKAAEALK